MKSSHVEDKNRERDSCSPTKLELETLKKNISFEQKKKTFLCETKTIVAKILSFLMSVDLVTNL